MNDFICEEKEVSKVLLPDGWHYVQHGSFSRDETSFSFRTLYENYISGPTSSLLAIEEG